MTSISDSDDCGLVQISRTCLVSGDVGRLRRFYQDMFGFAVLHDTAVNDDMVRSVSAQWHLSPGAELYVVVLQAPEGKAMLGITGVVGQELTSLDRPLHHAPIAGDHYFILRVRNLPLLAAKLVQASVEVWRPLTAVGEGWQMGIYDPDGTRLIIEQVAA